MATTEERIADVLAVSSNQKLTVLRFNEEADRVEARDVTVKDQELWFDAEKDPGLNWNRYKKIEGGFHFSGQSKPTAAGYRQRLHREVQAGSRMVQSRSVKAKLPVLEITEYDTPEEIQAKREAHEVALAAVATPKAKQATKSAQIAEKDAEIATLRQQLEASTTPEFLTRAAKAKALVAEGLAENIKEAREMLKDMGE